MQRFSFFNSSNTTLVFIKRFIFIPLSLLITSTVHQDDRKANPEPDVERELRSFKVAEGFEVTLFAADPLVAKPIQMNWWRIPPKFYIFLILMAMEKPTKDAAF